MCMHMHGCYSIWTTSVASQWRLISWMFFPKSHPAALLPLMLLRNHKGKWGGREAVSRLAFGSSVQLFAVHHFLFSPPQSSPLRPRSPARLDSGWSRSWAHCRAARLSRSLHSSLWTWGPAIACWGLLVVCGLRHASGSRSRPGPRSYCCRVGEGFGMEGRALKAALVKTPEEFKSSIRPKYDYISESPISFHTSTRMTWIILTLTEFEWQIQ